MLLLLLVLPYASASTTKAERVAQQAAQRELDTSPSNGNIPSYQLSPAALSKGQALQRSWQKRHFAAEVWSIVQLLLLLHFGLVRRFQAIVTHRFRSRWAQSYAFLMLFLLATALLSLPLDIYAQWIDRFYGLSVQSWAGWTGDLTKALLLTWAVGGLVVALLCLCIRQLPRKWWLAFWLASIPMTLAGVFLTPYVIDPLFNRFEPLTRSQPQLVERLVQVAQRGHMDIPPERMFLMKASDKVTTLNAYVTGFGASKRVVVWDTSLAKGTPDEVLFIFGHESGHYVLHHIVQGIFMSTLGLLVLLYLGFLAVQWAIRQFGPRWGVNSEDNWGTLAILMLAFSCASLVLEPALSSMSRIQEHAADVYGQEAIHGLVADPARTARDAFQVLGGSSFDVPNPSQLLEFWSYSHPSIGRRAAFAAHYQPWASGMQPKYFR